MCRSHKLHRPKRQRSQYQKLCKKIQQSPNFAQAKIQQSVAQNLADSGTDGKERRSGQTSVVEPHESQSRRKRPSHLDRPWLGQPSQLPNLLQEMLRNVLASFKMPKLTDVLLINTAGLRGLAQTTRGMAPPENSMVIQSAACSMRVGVEHSGKAKEQCLQILYSEVGGMFFSFDISSSADFQ